MTSLKHDKLLLIAYVGTKPCLFVITEYIEAKTQTMLRNQMANYQSLFQPITSGTTFVQTLTAC